MSRLSPLAILVTVSVIFADTSHADTSITALRNHAGEQLRLEATAKTTRQQNDAAVALCDLYVVLRSDERFGESELLQGTATRVRRRLINISKRLIRQLKREGKERPAGFSEMVDQAVETSLSSESLSEENQSASSTLQGANAPGEVANGWALVELIQRVISPDFWQPVGGPGTAYYFPMRRLLVIRATTDVHQQIKDLLMALR
ncbi:MAG: hypothetical protein AAFU85_15845 [Planctomycetota bacterium]